MRGARTCVHSSKALLPTGAASDGGPEVADNPPVTMSQIAFAPESLAMMLSTILSALFWFAARTKTVPGSRRHG